MTTQPIERPSIVDDEHLFYLDQLRESGVTNMFAAPQYLVEDFDVSKADARTIFKYWSQTFGNPTR